MPCWRPPPKIVDTHLTTDWLPVPLWTRHFCVCWSLFFFVSRGLGGGNQHCLQPLNRILDPPGYHLELTASPDQVQSVAAGRAAKCFMRFWSAYLFGQLCIGHGLLHSRYFCPETRARNLLEDSKCQEAKLIHALVANTQFLGFAIFLVKRLQTEIYTNKVLEPRRFWVYTTTLSQHQLITLCSYSLLPHFLLDNSSP